MKRTMTRREIVRLAPLGVGAFALSPSLAYARSNSPDAAPDPLLPHFPHTDPELARKVVGFSHAKLDELRPLVEERPTLANAVTDWGFGDWETAIGAASHTGRRDIADFLMSHGARPDVFTFAMLGNLAAVRAMIEATPGLQRRHGPHGITLVAHAKAGGEGAKEVLAYLTSLGDADQRSRDEALSDEDKKSLQGNYVFGPAERDTFVVGEGMGGLTIMRVAGVPRRLFHQGGFEFLPAGAPLVRIRFERGEATAKRLRVTDGDIVLVGESSGS